MDRSLYSSSIPPSANTLIYDSATGVFVRLSVRSVNTKVFLILKRINYYPSIVLSILMVLVIARSFYHTFIRSIAPYIHTQYCTTCAGCFKHACTSSYYNCYLTGTISNCQFGCHLFKRCACTFGLCRIGKFAILSELCLYYL